MEKPTPNTSSDDNDVLLAPSSLSLPYDLLVMIVARVPILYYPSLSLVSKSFRAIVASPELYKVRSLLGLTESCLYVCLRVGLGSYKWYTLSSKCCSSGGYFLARVPVPDDSPPRVDLGSGYSDLVAVGSDIYNISEADTPGVSILDCKSHRWRKAPSMPVELDELSARVIDRKIYVLECYQDQDVSWENYDNNFLQVFDTSTQTWDIPCDGVNCAVCTCVIKGKLHAATLFGDMFAFDSKQARWDLVEHFPRMRDIAWSVSYCEIDNVLYSVSEDGALRWYDTNPEKTMWRDLKGLVGMPKLPTRVRDCYVNLTGYGGGKMMVFWNRRSLNSYLFRSEAIYCAEIALERREGGDCWGKLERHDFVLSVPLGTDFVKVLAVTI